MIKYSRPTPWNTATGRVISLISRKGGVGKTTSAVNLGAALTLSGHSVLIVGTDPQCGVCRTLGRKPQDLSSCLSDIFGEATPLAELAQESPLPNLHFVSPRILCLRDEESLLEMMNHEVEVFRQRIDEARSVYDTILIDCAPSLGATTRAALLSSDSYLVPVQAEELCRNSMAHLLEFVDTFRVRNYSRLRQVSGASYSQPLRLDGLFLTMYDKRTKAGKLVTAKLDEDYSHLLFQSYIPRNVRLAEMAVQGKPAVIFDRRSAGSRAYFNLADELVQRYNHIPDNHREDASLDASKTPRVIAPPANSSEDQINAASRFSMLTEEGWE